VTYQPIPEIQLAIEKAAGCPAEYLRTAIVIEGWKEQMVWQGEVEVFTLKEHPKAKVAFGWKNFEGDLAAVIGVPPIESPDAAVRDAIVAKHRAG
jgi:hypothetical protein